MAAPVEQLLPAFGGGLPKFVEIVDHLEILSDDPLDRGWLIRIKMGQETESGLLDASAYEELIAEKE